MWWQHIHVLLILLGSDFNNIQINKKSCVSLDFFFVGFTYITIFQEESEGDDYEGEGSEEDDEDGEGIDDEDQGDEEPGVEELGEEGKIGRCHIATALANFHLYFNSNHGNAFEHK